MVAPNHATPRNKLHRSLHTVSGLFEFVKYSVKYVADLEHLPVGTCTMAIVMLSAFQPGELPGVPPSRAFSPMDVASYNDVWNAVRQVMDNCISEYLAIDKTTPKIRGAINFRSQTGWGAFGTLRLSKLPSQFVADVGTSNRK